MSSFISHDDTERNWSGKPFESDLRAQFAWLVMGENRSAQLASFNSKNCYGIAGDATALYQVNGNIDLIASAAEGKLFPPPRMSR
jgi:hypothetical protein